MAWTERHDIRNLLFDCKFPYICNECIGNKCKGIERKRLEKYINSEITFFQLILHKA